jgi:hypothetical protein
MLLKLIALRLRDGFAGFFLKVPFDISIPDIVGAYINLMIGLFALIIFMLAY